MSDRQKSFEILKKSLRDISAPHFYLLNNATVSFKKDEKFRAAVQRRSDRLHFIWSFETWDRFNKHERLFETLHLCQHLMSNHFTRLKPKLLNPKTKEIAGLAIDLAANHTVLRKFDFNLASIPTIHAEGAFVDTVAPELGMSDELSAEEYFFILNRRQQQQEQEKKDNKDQPQGDGEDDDEQEDGDDSKSSGNKGKKGKGKNDDNADDDSNGDAEANDEDTDDDSAEDADDGDHDSEEPEDDGEPDDSTDGDGDVDGESEDDDDASDSDGEDSDDSEGADGEDDSGEHDGSEDAGDDTDGDDEEGEGEDEADDGDESDEEPSDESGEDADGDGGIEPGALDNHDLSAEGDQDISDLLADVLQEMQAADMDESGTSDAAANTAELEEAFAIPLGTLAGAGVTGAVEAPPPVVDSNPAREWRKFAYRLEKSVRHDKGHTSWTPNKRFVGLTQLHRAGMFLPSYNAPQKSQIRVVVFLDTSGSCVWMAPTFMTILHSMPHDIFEVTAFTFTTVVIPCDLRKPTYHSGGTSFMDLERNFDEVVAKDKAAGKNYLHYAFVLTDGEVMHKPFSPKNPKEWFFFMYNIREWSKDGEAQRGRFNSTVRHLHPDVNKVELTPFLPAKLVEVLQKTSPGYGGMKVVESAASSIAQGIATKSGKHLPQIQHVGNSWNL